MSTSKFSPFTSIRRKISEKLTVLFKNFSKKLQESSKTFLLRFFIINHSTHKMLCAAYF